MESGGELDEKLMISNIFTNFDSDKGESCFLVL